MTRNSRVWINRALAALGLVDVGRAGSDHALGRRGERLAARWLRRRGYVIIARNVHLKMGEADIVCLAPDRQTIVVVEVKTRLRGESVSEKGNLMAPEASVHAQKRRKLLAVARSLSRANRWDDRPLRIDVVAIEWPDTKGKPEVRHHEGAVAVSRARPRHQPEAAGSTHLITRP